MAVRERRRGQRRVRELKADLYGSIATLDSIVRKFEEGDLNPTLYKRQLRSLVRDTLTARQLLEAEGSSWEDFLLEEHITERFPEAAGKLQIAEQAVPGHVGKPDVRPAEVFPFDPGILNTAFQKCNGPEYQIRFNAVKDCPAGVLVLVNRGVIRIDPVHSLYGIVQPAGKQGPFQA